MHSRRGNRLLHILMLVSALLIITAIINNSTSVLKLLYPVKYEGYVMKYAARHNVDPFLVYAIIKAESGFDSKATSKRNARGLMQITDKTGQWGADSLKLASYSSNDLYNAETNINIGCWYISKLMIEFNNNTDLVIAAYNGGSGNVTEWLKNSSYSSSGEKLLSIPFKETDAYLKKVKRNYYIYTKLYR